MYFTVIAGNSDYPLEGFDENGKSTYSNYVGVDSRGMWYNTKTKKLEINQIGEAGWASIKFNSAMTSHEAKQIKTGQFQPGMHSCGTYYPPMKSVIFFNQDNSSIDFYNYKNPDKMTSLKLEFKTDFAELYNETFIGYTGKKGYEFALFNAEMNMLVYFDTNGQETATTQLPLNPAPQSFLLFSYANDRAFLYDTETRTWTAYKVF
jgi:hypothetical protein